MAGYSQDAQLEYVKRRMVDYFGQVAQIARDYAPPGVNAANGWVRTLMVDGHLDMYGNPPTLELDGDALRLFSAYRNYFLLCQSGFQARDNFSASFLDEVDTTFEKLVKGLLEDLEKILKDVLALTSFNPTKIINLMEDIRKYIKDILAKGTLVTGRHLNGWIAVDVKRAAESTQSMLTDFVVGSPTGKLAAVFNTGLQKLSDLSTGDPMKDKSIPWLRADWQAKFYTINLSMTTAIQNL